jgi:hypothetical protein
LRHGRREQVEENATLPNGADGSSRRNVLVTATAAAGALAGAGSVLADTVRAGNFGAPLVEVHVPMGVLTLEQKSAMIKGITDVVLGAMKQPADPRQETFCTDLRNHRWWLPATFSTGYRKQLRCFFLLCVAAAGALAVSVISDGVLTALRPPEAELSVEFLISIFSIAIEIACAGALVFQIRSFAQRATSTATLLST